MLTLKPWNALSSTMCPMSAKTMACAGETWVRCWHRGLDPTVGAAARRMRLPGPRNTGARLAYLIRVDRGPCVRGVVRAVVGESALEELLVVYLGARVPQLVQRRVNQHNIAVFAKLQDRRRVPPPLARRQRPGTHCGQHRRDVRQVHIPRLCKLRRLAHCCGRSAHLQARMRRATGWAWIHSTCDLRCGFELAL